MANTGKKKKEKKNKTPRTDHSNSENLNPSAAALVQSQRDLIQNYGKAQNTKKAYDRYVLQGETFLKNLARDEEETNSGGSNRGSEVATINATNAAFRESLTGAPNEWTPQALVLFITQKCVEGSLGQSTADGIRSAFKYHWSQLAGDKYRKEWRFDANANEWVGNPADAALVVDLMKALKHKKGSDGSVRHHSRAMKYEYMVMIIQWSEWVCPVALVSLPPRSPAECTFQTMHLQLRAFFTTAFTLWTRNDELVKLRRCDIELNCSGPPPYYLMHFQIRLSNRKGWQRKLDKNEESLEANTYGIYDQPDFPCINCYVHLLKYIQYIELHHYKGSLSQTDYIFPAMSINSVIQRGQHISTETVQGWLDEAVASAGIDSLSSFSFSTHCFRRGGAQYRFMYAPHGLRWPIGRIRWWGGWAEHEHSDTLVRYLIDELEANQECHTDALSPIAPESDKSLMGEHTIYQTATKGEVRGLRDSLCQHISAELQTVHKDVTGRIDNIHRDVENVHFRLSSIENFISSIRPHIVATGNRNALEPTQHTLNQASEVTLPASETNTPPPHYIINGQINQLTTHSFEVQGQQHLINNITTTSTTVNSAAVPPAPQQDPDTLHFCIPKLPVTGRSAENSLEDLIFQWDNAVPELGLPVALKDWPHGWYNGVNRPKFGAMYNMRKKVALEYIDRFKRDDAAFKAAYPMWESGHCAILEAIKEACRQRGEAPIRMKRATSGESITRRKKTSRILAGACI